MSKEKKILPKDYQTLAVNKFIENNYKGIFEMATGTGKTITSLLCAEKYFMKNDRIFLIILVPFTHLIEQWKQSARLFNIKVNIKCYGNKKDWLYSLESHIRDFNIGISKFECVITTYKTGGSKDFIDLVNRIKGKSFLIADECHYFGTMSFIKNHFINLDAKLGLSATPDRWWDEEGTKFLKKYFGDVIYTYSMEEAINNGALTPYEYYPIKVSLTEEEVNKYIKITKTIMSLYQEKEPDYSKIEALNRKRGLIIAKCQEKENRLITILKEQLKEGIHSTIVYVAPGEVEKYLELISDIGIKVQRFDSKIPMKNREIILKAFKNREIEVLVAIKCLDEGVDVPSTETAYFVASTSNPREFIQRRGRVLRVSPGKKYAKTYDFIVIPKENSDRIFEIIVKKEFPRFAEFSSYARNKYQARDTVKKYLEGFDLEYIMDKLPWEVYKENKEEYLDE